MGWATAKRSTSLRGARKVLRDFLGGLFVFSALFIALAPSRLQSAPVPVLSLFDGTAMATSSRAERAVGEGHAGSLSLPVAAPIHSSLMDRPLPVANVPLISSVLSLLFASMVAFNLALFRHLRRVNASSRRSVWREG